MEEAHPRQSGPAASSAGRATETAAPEEILFTESFPTPSGKGRFVAAAWAPADELPNDEYPLVLNTGRVLQHWHTGTMTRRAKALDAIAPGPFVEVNPDDLKQLGIADGELVRIRSRRGHIEAPARSADRCRPGSVFVPFHSRKRRRTS